MESTFNIAVPLKGSDKEYAIAGNALDFVRKIFPGKLSANDPAIQRLDNLPDLPINVKALIIEFTPTRKIIRAAYTTIDKSELQNALINAILKTGKDGVIPIDENVPSTGLLGLFSQPNFIDILGKLGLSLNTFFLLMAVVGGLQVARGKSKILWGGVASLGSYNYIKTKF